MSLHLVLITGMSGSGKSVALNALEDSGYYCIDNLPPELLLPFVGLAREQGRKSVAVAVDVRSARSLPQVPKGLATLQNEGVRVRSLFLEATTETLVRRFSESRRRHPLTRDAAQTHHYALSEAIDLERELLSELRLNAHIIDTSLIRANQLQSYVKKLIDAPASPLTLVFESFGFKRGIPQDADFVLDVRMLPNPHYEPALRPLTGCDEPVVEFLQQHEEVWRMHADIAGFLATWLPQCLSNHRSYVTVAIGCTGGQHRSVYLVETLEKQFSADWVTLKRHREMDARTAAAPGAS